MYYYNRTSYSYTLCLLLILVLILCGVENVRGGRNRNHFKPLHKFNHSIPFTSRSKVNAAFPYFIKVDRAEYVTGPSYSYPDNPVAAMRFRGKTFGYSSNAISYLLIQGKSMNVVRSTAINTGLGYAPNASLFDACGAWLNTVSTVGTNSAIGWYHAETECDYNVGQTRKSIAYATSTNGSYWWKPNYPDNQIITGYASFSVGQTTGAGDHTVISMGDFYYAYFLETPAYRITVARSPISSGGQPGTWLKWYQGEFSQPGLGGMYSPLHNIPGTSVSRIYADETEYLISVGGFSDGVFISVNDGMGSPTTWTSINAPLITGVGMTWARDSSSPELYAYVNFAAEDGSSDIATDADFYLYYAYLFPFEGFGSRYLMRQKISLVSTVAYDPPTYSMVVSMLARYRNSLGNYWTSNKAVEPSYKFDENIGYISTSDPDEENLLLVECQIAGNVSTNYVIQATTCTEGIMYRILGYIWTTRAAGRVPIYFCDSMYGVASSAYLSNDRLCGCNSSLYSTLLGYALDPKI